MGILDSGMFDPRSYQGLLSALPSLMGGAMPGTMQPGGFPPMPQQQPQPDPAALPQNAQPVQHPPLAMMPQAPEAPQQSFLESMGLGPNALMALGAGIAGGNSLGDSVSKGVGGLVAARQQNQTEAALVKRGLDPQMAKVVSANPALMSSVAGQLFKPQVTALSAQQKQALGLPANVPWFAGADGKPFVPEGLSQAKSEIKDVNGQLIAVNPLTNEGTQVTGVGAPKPKFDDVSSVRKEIGALPEVKRYGEAVPIYRSMLKSKGTDTSAADLDFVYGVAKIFDPESVVREGEMKLVGSAQSLPEDIKAFMGSVALAKGRLTPEARERILEVAQTRMNELRGAYDTRTTPYNDFAKRNNMNPADIMPTLPGVPAFKAAPPVPQAAQPTAAGALPRMQSVQDAMKLKPGTRFIDANGVERIR